MVRCSPKCPCKTGEIPADGRFEFVDADGEHMVLRLRKDWRRCAMQTGGTVAPAPRFISPPGVSVNTEWVGVLPETCVSSNTVGRYFLGQALAGVGIKQPTPIEQADEEADVQPSALGYRYLNDDPIPSAIAATTIRPRSPTCYACDAPNVTPGVGDVPLCGKCRAGDGEATPEPVTFKDSVLNTIDTALWDAFFAEFQRYQDKAYADAFEACGVSPLVPSCRLCPAPATHTDYCAKCWYSRLTEMDRRDVVAGGALNALDQLPGDPVCSCATNKDCSLCRVNSIETRAVFSLSARPHGAGHFLTRHRPLVASELRYECSCGVALNFNADAVKAGMAKGLA